MSCSTTYSSTSNIVWGSNSSTHCGLDTHTHTHTHTHTPVCCAGVYLLRHLQLNQQEKYWRALRALLLQAQQLNDERMIDNPYLTAASMLSIEGQGC